MTLASQLFGGRTGSSASNTNTPLQQQNKDAVVESTPEPDLVLSTDEVIRHGVLDRAYKQPDAKSVIGRMKHGDMTGRNGADKWEELLGDIILAVQSAQVNSTIFLLARLAMNQTNSLNLAEQAKKALDSKQLTEDDLLDHIFDSCFESRVFLAVLKQWAF